MSGVSFLFLLRVRLAYFLRGLHERSAAAGDDPLFDRRLGRIDRILNFEFQILHLGLGRGADADDRHAAGEFGQALFEFFFIKLRRRVFYLRADLRDARVDLFFRALAADDDGLILGRNNFASAAEHIAASRFQTYCPSSRK